MLKTPTFLDDDEEEDSESDNRVQKIKSRFYSKLGKQRLSSIWKDQKLDHKVQASFPVSMLISGPSEAYLHEKVMEYMQHYLQNRAKTSSATMKFDGVEELWKSWNWKYNYDTKLKSLAEEKYEKLLLEKSEASRKKEESRILALAMRNPSYVQFLNHNYTKEKILQHPLNQLNVIQKRIKKLDEYYQYKWKHPLLFAEADEKVKYLASGPVVKEVGESKVLSTRNTKIDDGKLSASSGFHEMTPSPDFSNIDKDTSQAESIESVKENSVNRMDSLDDLSDGEYCQRQLFSTSSSMDECELIYNTKDVLIEKAFKDKINLFDEAEKLVFAYDRKLIVSEEFSQELGQNLNSEYFS